MKPASKILRYGSLLPLLILLILSPSSCGKYVGDYNSDFIGKWSTEIFIVNDTGQEARNHVNIDGKNSYYMFLCDNSNTCLDGATGNARINRKHTRLWIGDKGETTTIKITKEPYLDTDGKWKCVFNDVIYIKE